MEAIVAVYSDWGIGSDGTQPIVVSEDRQRFAALTRGETVLCGANALANFPDGKPFEGRDNIVICNSGEVIEGAICVYSVDEAVDEARRHMRTFVAGGATVYMALFPHFSRIFVTKIDSAPHCDAYFPNLDSLPEWECVMSEPYDDGVNRCTFCVYEKKRARSVPDEA